jgi:type III secretion protein V
MITQDVIDTQRQRAKPVFKFGNDIILAVALVFIVALMILPMSPIVLDVLVAINIVLGLMLVLMAIYIRSPIEFSSFPSVLLVTTLFRLSLSVATTRMILLEGNAGEIISAFGGFVAGGNIVVGLVVFLIITVVQFIVIAKGAERVAEVAARFSLDGMPGKQMSIDSDLRSGLISKDEARKKRHDLELEAKLHGSMDGAMKFVKGDAIAGIIIIIVNLLGGLAIGVLQLDMGVSDAMAKYSILTVGDGMVAQIPALLGALSAGLIVTRVTDSTDDTNLGDAIHKQIKSVPRVSLITGALCFFLSLVPGFPSVTFLVIGAMLVLAGLISLPSAKSKLDDVMRPFAHSVGRGDDTDELRCLSTSTALPDFTQTLPTLLFVSSSKFTRDELATIVNETQHTELSESRGLGIPLPQITILQKELNDQTWQLHIYEVPVSSSDSTSVPNLIASYREALTRQAHRFFGLQETSNLLNESGAANSDLVREVLRLMPMQNVANILKNLVSENISVRSIRTIFEVLAQSGQTEKDINILTEHVRIALGPHTIHQLAVDGSVTVVTLSVELESSLAAAIKSINGKIELNIDPVDGEKLIQSFLNAIEHYRPRAILTNIQTRRCVRMLIERQYFDVAVISHSELAHHARAEILGQVTPEHNSPSLKSA